MRILGLVQWTDRDKRGFPIAGVRPLVELQKGDWRQIDATEEFPSQGQAFWPNAQAAIGHSLVTFRAEPNPGHKDELKVADPKPASEVLDLRSYGSEAAIRVRLASGIPVPGLAANPRVLVWCKNDILLGPVELARAADGTAKLASSSLPRLPVYVGATVRAVTVDHTERLLRADDAPPSGYVDWDDDVIVLRRALEITVRVARLTGGSPDQTKKQIDEATRTLASIGLGPEAQLDRHRLERALILLQDTGAVASRASELAEILRGHPAIQASLDEMAAKVRREAESSARADLDQLLNSERNALKAATEDTYRAQLQLTERRQELLGAETRLEEFRTKAVNVAKEVEAAIEARVLAAIDRPLALLAEVSVLRPLLGAGPPLPAPTAVSNEPTSLDWSRPRGENLKDKDSLRRTLTAAARAHDVEPSIMLQLHAAVAARLLPATLGPGALAALLAYADGACAGRRLIIHVPPTAIQPRDLDQPAGGGLAAASAAAQGIDGLSLVLLEGANRSPLEASLMPFLQLIDAGISPISSATGLRVAATMVEGATTVPVPAEFWSRAVAIYARPTSRVAQPTSHLGSFSLSSDCFALGEPPVATIDELMETWPDCSELRPSLMRFGSALTRAYTDDARVAEALLHGLVLPYIATTLAAEDYADALSRAGDGDGALLAALRRLRRILC